MAPVIVCDDDLEAAFAEVLARWRDRLEGMAVQLAFEGLEVTL